MNLINMRSIFKLKRKKKQKINNKLVNIEMHCH